MCQVVILASASNPNPSTLLQTHNGLTTVRIKRHKNPSQDKAFDCVSDSQRLIHTATAKHLHFCPFEFWPSVVTSWTEGLWRDGVPWMVSLEEDSHIWRNTKQRPEMKNTVAKCLWMKQLVHLLVKKKWKCQAGICSNAGMRVLTAFVTDNWFNAWLALLKKKYQDIELVWNDSTDNKSSDRTLWLLFT